ncbi:MAG: NADH:ubiquinone reductase (Na(+)-transporting) subunit C [Chlamydiota bacterium]
MPEEKRSFSHNYILIFVTVLCICCALILALLAQLLKNPQREAKELYQSKQLLLAAKILSYDGHFLIPDRDGKWTAARYDQNQKILVAESSPSPPPAHDREILAVFQNRILTRLVDTHGTLYTFAELDIDFDDYLEKNAKLGYADLNYKLIYLVLPNLPPATLSAYSPPYGYVIPINGYGLWDAIYGYLGLAANGDTVLGITWYDQKETPGLGGEIGLPEWQQQFQGKMIFEQSNTTAIDPARAPIALQVVRGTVQEAGLSPAQERSAVDGIAGATFTVTGVNNALKSSLEPYRPFLVRAYEENSNG